jgi:hypothetical protein
MDYPSHPKEIYGSIPRPTSRLPVSQMTGKVKIKLLPRKTNDLLLLNLECTAILSMVVSLVD